MGDGYKPVIGDNTKKREISLNVWRDLSKTAAEFSRGTLVPSPKGKDDQYECYARFFL